MLCAKGCTQRDTHQMRIRYGRIMTSRLSRIFHLSSELARVLDGLVDGADHVERLFGQVVVFALDEAVEAGNGVLEVDEATLVAGEHLRDVERLREEALNLARARNGELVVFGKLVHAQNGDDVLKILVVLQNDLHATRHVVMLLPDDERRQHTARRVQRVDSGINAQLCNLARQHGRGVKMRKSSCRRRVSQVVGRHIDRLH
mmetsp:Transcript_613/g.1598  ORF Transcript_613/g.1598 Transcript_613/m.1598 type:complete len:203 (-) Transcript_613:914-1522(-)